jgi:ABC-type polysaccharide/polyol phosphate export permease
MSVEPAADPGGGRANLQPVEAETPTVPGAPPRPRHARQEDFNAKRHVYEPHRVGLPPLRNYLSEVWRRRQFAFELSRTTLRAQHFQTAFGQLWLILNPLLLSLVYFILVDILRHGNHRPHFFAHLLAGLFLFYFFSGAVTTAAKSVVGGGRLVLNTAFPRTLLPLSAVITGVLRFLPTLLIYAVVHVASGLPIRFELLWMIPIIGILTIFSAGVAMLVAAAQVYFRDVSSFLPYLMRIWMYGTPILYFYAEVPEKFKWLIDLNPLTPLFTAWSDVLILGQSPPATYLLWGLGCALAALVIGGLFFISREREFAVRL